MCGLLGLVRLGLVLRQTIQCFASEVPLALEVARYDKVFLRVLSEPPTTSIQELLNFILTNPIMLLVVEDRDQDVQVRQQVAQAA